MTSERLRATVGAIVVAIGSVALVSAQERPTSVNGDADHAQVRAFEGVLRDAVLRVLDNMVATVEPKEHLRLVRGDVTSESVDPPAPGAGLTFVVRVPDLIATRTVAMSARAIPIPPASRNDTTPNVPGLFSAAVTEALLNVVVHNSAALTVDPDAWLTVVAFSSHVATTQPGDPRKLYVMVRGSDLLTIRRQTLPDEEARKLVVIAQR